ncbi:hypothetical protein DFH08DRAFT_801396 [Mycena albidolilacea]|uniref:Uncharacterized protein n=1 Tax=Mycena albidolilacea TaxID=1033008 RepID=A0AAD7AID4_9AGAR|nr:hypothetical protein DFH08DRAFT_801396 [Mycena albidolilacea]
MGRLGYKLNLRGRRAVFYQVRMIIYFQKRQVGEQETARRFGTMCRKRWRTAGVILPARPAISTRKRRVSSHEINGGLEFICYGVQLIPQITRHSLWVEKGTRQSHAPCWTASDKLRINCEATIYPQLHSLPWPRVRIVHLTALVLELDDIAVLASKRKLSELRGYCRTESQIERLLSRMGGYIAENILVSAVKVGWWRRGYIAAKTFPGAERHHLNRVRSTVRSSAGEISAQADGHSLL